MKHFTSNAMVVLNGAMGTILCILACVGVVFYADSLKIILKEVPELKEMMTPILCLVVISASSLNMISASSISLEGDRFWIIKSLPVSSKDILDIKLALHGVLCIPAGILLSIVLIVTFQTSIFDSLFILLAPIIFTLLIDFIGLLLNLWKPKFDWVNETVCVKQSMPVVITMFVSMGLAVAIAMLYGILLVDIMSIYTYMYIVIAVTLLLDIALYYLIYTWGVRQFDAL